MKIVQVIDQIDQAKEFEVAEVVKGILVSLGQGSVSKTIDEKLKFNADIAINSLKHIAGKDPKQTIYKFIEVLQKDAMKDYIENPVKIKELIESEDTVDSNLVDDAIIGVVTNISMSTVASIQQYSNIMTDDAIIAAQINDILNKVMRLNEIRVGVNSNKNQEYEYSVVLAMLFVGVLVNIEVLGYNAPKVLENTLKNVAYDDCKKQAND